MYQFKIKENGFKEIRNQMLIKTIPIMLLAVTVGIGMSEFNSNNQDDGISVLTFTVPIVLLSIFFGLFIGVKRQKVIFDSYTLTLAENQIIREQANAPTVKVNFSDIREITKNSNGSLTIRGIANTDIIGIPPQTENLSELERQLSKIKSITEKNAEPILQKLMFPFVVLTLGLMATLYISTNKILVSISGLTLLGIMIWSFVETQRSKNIDTKTKKSMYWLIFVLIFIIGQMYMKLR